MPAKPKPIVPPAGKCIVCKEPYFLNRADKVYCGPKCRNKDWVKNHPRINK